MSHLSLNIRQNHMHFRLTTSGSESLIIWQDRRSGPCKPQITQRCCPRNMSRCSIPMSNAVVVDKSGISRSPHSWREEVGKWTEVP